MAQRGRRVLVLTVFLVLIPALVHADKQFESPQVHSLQLSPDGTKLFALNTPDHRLVVFDLTQGSTPVVFAEIQVGIEPVTVRARDDSPGPGRRSSDKSALAGQVRLKSLVCGLRWGRRMAPPVVGPLSRKMCTPLVISDS